jgi:hypothetical protein
MKIAIRLIIVVLIALTMRWAHAADTRVAVNLTGVSPIVCLNDCQHADAVVFVHGIYGDEETFRNADTGFDWPSDLPDALAQREGLAVDVYRLNYQSALLAWARQKNPDFVTVADAIGEQLGQLRRKGY